MPKRLVMPGQLEILALTTAAPVVTFRVPRPKEVDPFFGGTRTFWLERTLRTQRNSFKPEVESVVIKKPGASRGMRFVLYDSAAAYFQQLRKSQQDTDVNTK